MGCPPVRGDNPRALTSGLSYVQVDKHGITVLYHLHHLAHHEIFRAKVGKGGMSVSFGAPRSSFYAVCVVFQGHGVTVAFSKLYNIFLSLDIALFLLSDYTDKM